MNNKVLIKLIVPSIDDSFEIYIPVNEVISKIVKLVVKSVSELSDGSLNLNQNYCLLDPDNSTIYKMNDIVRDTNIINSKVIMLI